jgi:hypothetical protein
MRLAFKPVGDGYSRDCRDCLKVAKLAKSAENAKHYYTNPVAKAKRRLRYLAQKEANKCKQNQQTTDLQPISSRPSTVQQATQSIQEVFTG